MEMKEIIEIIKKKERWDSTYLIEIIESEEKKQTRYEFCRIGGYELMRDGTKTDVCTTIEEVQYLLEEYGIDFDKNIDDIGELVKSISEAWEERFDDGGGSGWIE